MTIALILHEVDKSIISILYTTVTDRHRLQTVNGSNTPVDGRAVSAMSRSKKKTEI